MKPSNESPGLVVKTEGDHKACSFYSAATYRAETSVGYLMHRIVTELSHEIERQLKPSGLTNAQWAPLFMLFTGEASTVSDLARRCNLDAGAMTRLLDRLESKGLCCKTRSQSDRRMVIVELTDAGRVAASSIPVILSGIQNQILAGFTRSEFVELNGLLRRIVANHQSMSDDSKSVPREKPT